MDTALDLRCYARRYQSARRRWLAHCLDLDLVVVGCTREDAQESLADAVCVYAATVSGINDYQEALNLLVRRAPRRHYLWWWVARLIDAPTLLVAFTMRRRFELRIAVGVKEL